MFNYANGILEEIKRRKSNPFLSSATIALATINYKVIFVLFSTQEYAEKFCYIERTLYPSRSDILLQLIIYPGMAALFFTFVWPLIDTEISVIHIKLENRKKLKSLLAEQKQPIDQADQAQFFESQNKEVQELKSKVGIAIERERRITRELNEKIGALQQNIKSSAFQRLADYTELDATEIQTMFNLDGQAIRRNENFVKAVRSIPHTKYFEKIIAAIDKLPIEDDYKKTGHIGWISSVINKPNSHAIFIHDLFFALGLFGELQSDGKSFDINHNHFDLKDRIMEMGSISKSPSEH